MNRGLVNQTDRQKRLVQIAATIPELHVGDVWTGISGESLSTIVRFESFDGGAFPWPRVYLENEFGGIGHTGAPAFKFATLVKRGTGERWAPPVKVP